MKLKLSIASLLLCFIASAQITDPTVLRNYINTTIVPNNVRNVTAQQLNNILNGTLNVMSLSDIDSFSTSRTFDTLYVYQHTSTNQVVRKGYHIGGNFDTTSLSGRINALNTTKLNASDSLSKYVTPSQLQQVSGGNVYHPGDNIIQISGSAISVDTITGVPTKNFVFANFPPKTRKVNNKSLTSDITLNKSDFPDLNLVDNTSDMDKPLSNKQRDSLSRKVDKTTTVNGKTLSANIIITKDDIGLTNVDNVSDADKPVSNATKDSLNANTFQRTLNRGSDLTRDNTVNAGDYQFNIAAKSVSIKGKGMTTKFGVIQNPNSNTNLLASLMGTGVVRSGYTFTAANATPMLTLLNNGYEVVVNLNAFAQDGSRGFLSVAELPQYRKTLDSLFTVYFTGRNAHIFFNMNEQFNSGYYNLDSSSAAKYLAMQNIFDSAVHAHGGLTMDGGLTGPSMLWLPYKDLLDQGRTDDANEYAQAMFTSSQIAGGLNWDVSGPYKLQIYLTRQWLAGVKGNSTNFINLHVKTNSNGIDGDSINPRPYQWLFDYYSKAAGKPAASNELGAKSPKQYIAKQLFKVATDKNLYLAIWYSGTGTTFNAEDINLLSGSSLSAVGAGLKVSFDTATISQRIAMTVQDGKVSYPGVGTGVKLPAYFDENSNLVPGPLPAGSTVDTGSINSRIAAIKQVSAFSKNATRDSTILVITDANGNSQRYAVKDSVGAGTGSTGTVTNIAANNKTGQTWSITNPSTTPNIDLSLTKDAVGLGNVDNVSDVNKPVSSATQTALNGKQDALGYTAANNSDLTNEVARATAAEVMKWGMSGNSFAAGSSFIGTTNNTSLRFRTNNVETAVLDSTGNLGLGNFGSTIAPLAHLHVVDNGLNQNRGLILEENVDSNYSSVHIFRKSRGTYSSPNPVLPGDYVGATYYAPRTSTGYRFNTMMGVHVPLNGTVGAGTVTGDWFVANGTTPNIDPFAGGSTAVKLIVKSDGKVGFGDQLTDPTARVDIGGDLRIRQVNTGNTSDSVLTINGGIVTKSARSNFSGSGGSTDTTSLSRRIDRKPRVFNVLDYGAAGDGATNDQPAVQAAINAAFSAGGGVVLIPNNLQCRLGGNLVTSGTGIGNPNSLLYIPQRSQNDAGGLITIEIRGEFAPNATYSGLSTYNPKKTGAALIADPAAVSGTYPSILGTDGTGANGYYGVNYGVYVIVRNINFVVKNRVGSGPNMCGINFKTLGNATIEDNVIGIDTAFVNSSYPSAETFGIYMPSTNNGTILQANRNIIGGFKDGMIISEHFSGSNNEICVCENGLVAEQTNHSIHVDNIGIQWCKHALTGKVGTITGVGAMNNKTSISIDALNCEYRVNGSWYDTRYVVNDSLNMLYGVIYYSVVEANVGLNNTRFSKNGGGNLNSYAVAEQTNFFAQYRALSGASSTGITSLQNTTSTAPSIFKVINNNNDFLQMGNYGTGYAAVPAWTGNSVLSASGKLIISPDGNVSTSGTSPVDFITGGFSNTNSSLRITGGNPGNVLAGGNLAVGSMTTPTYKVDISATTGFDGVRVTNTGSTATAKMAVVNNGGVEGSINAYGSSQAVSSLAGKVSIGSTGSFVMFGTGASASGGTGTLSFRPDGYDIGAERMLLSGTAASIKVPLTLTQPAIFNGAVTYTTSSTPADPTSGSCVGWFDGTNYYIKKNVGGTISTSNSGIDATHPVTTGGTPTVSNSAGSAISSISVSGTDANMKLSFTIPTGQTVNGYVCTVTYAGAWSAAPKAGITPSMDATNFAAIGTQYGAGEETTTTFKVRAYNLSAGTYTYTIKSAQ